VKESQVINLNDEMAQDDTVLFAYEDIVGEFMDNVTGIYGHTIAQEGVNGR
jgi:hypothetical protein